MSQLVRPNTASRVGWPVCLMAHAAAFAAVNLILSVQGEWRWDAGYFWGWGIGLAAHVVSVLLPHTGTAEGET